MGHPKRWHLILLLPLALYLVGGEYVLVQAAEKAKIIRTIDIKGNKRVGTAAIKGAVKLKEGDVYNTEAVSQDVSSIWAMGYFDNVEVILEDYEDGLKLTFLVTERPIIKAIIFEGNKELGKGKLEEALELKEGDYLKYYLVKLGQENIKELYLKKGFQFVDIDSEIRKLDGEAEVVYRIVEGPKATIQEIKFLGNTAFSSRKLRKQIKTRKRRFPTLLFKGVFDSEKFEDDKEKLRDFYVDRGWLDVKVDGKLTYSPDRSDIYVTFVLEEGERYYVNEITVKGNKLFTTQELLEMMRLKKGEPFLPPRLEQDSKEVRTLYGEQGFINAVVSAKRSYNPLEATVNVSYELTEGQRVFIEEVRITGNERTKDNVIRRELSFLPGERFDSVKIRESSERLQATGYFDTQSPAPVNIYPESGSKPDLSNVAVEVKEGRSGLLRLGGGFGVNSGLFGDISYTDRNFNIFDPPKSLHDFIAGNAFRGAGHVLNLKFSPGLRRTEAILSLTNPSIFDSPYSAGGSFFFFTRGREDFTEERKGARFSIGRMITKNTNISLSPGIEDIIVKDVDVSAPKEIKDLEGSLTKLGAELRIARDTRDNPMFPTRGSLVDTSIEGSGLDVSIWRFVVSGTKFKTIFESPRWGKHVLALKGSVGVVRPHSGEKEVPIFERFFAGGAGSIRGFDFRGVSPVDTGTGAPVQVGGEDIILAGIEDDFPIGHGEKSVMMVQKYIDLTPQEAMIIRWHMGSFDPAWEEYKEKVIKHFPEVVLFNHVDIEVPLMYGL
ncbi:MAG TPA: outer membrane protein assembly factor BamA [Candidatus Hypogeohydataceae bacterium YC40]